MKFYFLLLICAASSLVSAQTLNNTLSFKPGQKFEVTTSINRSAEQEMMGRSMESSISSSTLTVFDVTASSPAATTLGSSTKRLKFDVSMMGREEKFDSDNTEDMNSNIGKMMSTALNTKHILTIDNKGILTEVKTVEPEGTKRKGDPAAGMMAMMMGSMDQGGAPVAGDASMFKILPDRPVSVGDTWNDEIKNENGTRKTAYTIKSATDSEIFIEFDEDATMDMKQEVMGQQASISVKSKSVGKIVLDRATGLLKQKTFVTNSQEDVSAGGMSIPSKSKMTTTIVVKPM